MFKILLVLNATNIFIYMKMSKQIYLEKSHLGSGLMYPWASSQDFTGSRAPGRAGCGDLERRLEGGAVGEAPLCRQRQPRFHSDVHRQQKPRN